MNVQKQGEIKRTQTVKITGASLEGLPKETGNDMAKNVQTGPKTPIINEGPKVGRNDLCPCGSGKKYKNCCGKNA